MEREIFEVKRERFDLTDRRRYLLQGDWPKEYEARAYLDGVRVETEMEPWENKSAMERFRDLDADHGERITMSVYLPENVKGCKKLEIYGIKGDKKIPWFSIKGAELARRQGKPQYYIEEEKISFRDHSCQIRGWAAAKEHVAIRVFDEDKKPIECNIQMTNRIDVTELFKECEIEAKCGFFIELAGLSTRRLYLVFKAGETKAVHVVELQRGKVLQKKAGDYWKKGMRYYSSHGVRALVGKSFHKLAGVTKRPVTYEKWLPKHLPDEGELREQRNHTFAYAPKISIVVPLYKTPVQYLEKMIASVQAQTYGNWELCLSDGSGADSPLAEVLKSWQQREKRIRVISHEEALRIAPNTNAAIEAATGEFVAFMDHDDELLPHALYECVKVLNAHRNAEVIYSDEDKMSMDGNKFFQPHFKPDFNIDLLCTVNYICHLLVVKRSLIDQVGMLREEFDGAQDYDFVLRCVEATKAIYHVPKILYHWRSHEDSTSENPESKLYAFEAGKRAVQAHFDRIGVKAEVCKGEYLGLYRTRYLRDHDPLVSIIIPNKDHVEDLKRCIGSIEEKSTYKNLEYIIVENNSTEDATFAYYKELEVANPKVHVVYWKDEFNYSAINNFGVSFAKGEYLLLLNNDTEIINDDCIEELLGYCMRPDVGIVGARLYYEDDTIQHAGCVIGFGGIAGHCFVQQPRGYTGYCHRIICAQNYSAVTAACMMVDRKAFEAVNGLSEELKVAFNDIDFCLRVQEAGYLVVYNPYAELYHYESKSRGLEDTPEKVARFQGEIKTFEERWPEILRNGDPYYNPNLTLESQDFSLRRI